MITGMTFSATCTIACAHVQQLHSRCSHCSISLDFKEADEGLQSSQLACQLGKVVYMWPCMRAFSNRSDSFGRWVSLGINRLILIWLGIVQNKDLHLKFPSSNQDVEVTRGRSRRLSSSPSVLPVHIHPPNHVKYWIQNGVDVSLLAHHHMCLLLGLFSAPSFIIHLPLKCRCLIDENDHIKLTIMCTMPCVTVRALKCKKLQVKCSLSLYTNM